MVTEQTTGTRPLTAEELERRGGRVLRTHSDGANRRRLWDSIDQTWTAALSMETALFKADQVIFKCSSCLYTSMFNKAGEGPGKDGGEYQAGSGASTNGIRSHARKAIAQGEDHRGAVVERQDKADACSACGATFERARRLGFCQKHIDAIRESGEAHKHGVRQVTMKRYTLGASEPVILQEEDALAPLEGSGTEVNQLVEDAPRRPRKRRRSRNRRKR